jgi:hypothetical protein
MIHNICDRRNFSWAKLKTIFNHTFPYLFVVDPYGIWTMLKMLLMPLNSNR